MKRRWLCPGLGLALLACSGSGPAEGDEVASSDEGLSREASPVAASDGEVAALAPRPGLSVEVSTELGELSMGLSLPELPSRASFGPAIALTYASAPGDPAQGFGVGFSLDVPSIQMTTDWGVPYRGLVDAGSRDLTARLSLGAERLVWVGSSTWNGKPKIEYRLDVAESAVRLFRYPQGGSVSIRDASGALQSVAFTGFEVVYPDGRREIYSEDPAVAEGAALASGFFATRWPLVHAVGPTGEGVSYEYTKTGERSYVSRVRFAGGRSVYTLESEERSRGRVSHRMGFPQGPGRRYTKLTARFDGELMHSWCFAHAVRGEGGVRIATHPDCQALAEADFAAERERLESSLGRDDKLLGVYRFGRSGPPYDSTTPAEPLVRFGFVAWGESEIARHELVYDMAVPDVFGFGPGGGSELFDIDSDGLADIVRYAAREATSFLSYNTGDLTAASLFTAGPALTVERNAGGITRRDVPRFDGAAQATSVFLSGDFDGDGRTDLVQALASGTRTEIVHYPGRGDRSRPFVNAASSTFLSVELPRFARGRTQALDVNADGKADLLMSVPGATDSTWTAFINVTQPGESALSFVALTGLRFPFRQGAGSELDNPAYRFLDANSDGLTDFAVIRSSGAGEKGLCIYENQGKVTAYPAARQARLSAGALLFGAPSASDAQCAQGRFVPVPGIESSQNVNAMWLTDVNGDGDTDLVNVTPAASELGVWLGRGQEGFDAPRRVPLEEGVSVDPANKWNTRVLDIDADGMEEILVYEPDASGGRIKVIDFNRDGIKNRIGPDLLATAVEGPGLRHAVQYATSMDETSRDARLFGRDDARVRPLPYPITVVKRHFTAVGTEAPRVLEYQYHAPYFNEQEREFAGFGECETLDYGDDSSASVVVRQRYHVASATPQTRRFFAGKLRAEEVFEPRLSAAQAAQSAIAWPAGIDGVSQTAETRGEEAYVMEALLAVHEEGWAVVPPAPGPRTPAFLRQTTSRDTRCSGSGCLPACAAAPCAGADNVTRAFTYDSTYNRLIRVDESMPAVAGPSGTELPARSYVRTYAYDAGWEARGVLTALQEESVFSSPSNRVLQRTSLVYGPDLPLPVSRTEPFFVDAEALAGLPEAARAQLLAPRARVETYRYDAFGNVVETADALGLQGTVVYDATGVLQVETRNALGYATQYCYGTAGCALSAVAPQAETGVPARSLSPTHVRTPQGDVMLTEHDARHRPVRVARTSGATTRYAYRDAGGETPALVRIEELRSESETASTRVERLAAFRADGLALGQAVKHEAGGARVASFTRHDRRGAAVFQALPYASELGIGAAFDAGRFPAPESGASGATAAHDGLGRVVRTTDAAQLITRIAYEPWGQRVEATLGTGPGASVETRSTVARGEEVYAIVDELGQVHRYERDERGRLSAIRMAGYEVPRRVAYDSSGSLVMTSLPGGLTRLWVRDARGRVAEQRTWDRAFAASESIDTTYDALDRPTAQSAASSSRPDGWDELSFTYDARDGEAPRPELTGRLVTAEVFDRVSGHRVRTAFEYGQEGRLTRRQTIFEAEDARRVYDERLTYGLDGTIASYRDPFGNTLSFERTPEGAPSSITWSASGRAAVPLLADIAYDARGELAGYRMPSTRLRRQLGHEPSSGRLTHLSACVGDGQEPCAGGAVQDVTYDRRADGRVVAAREAGDAPRVTSYTYSARGELLGTSGDGTVDVYAYTPAGQIASFGERAEASPFHAEPGRDGLALPEGAQGELDAFGRLVAWGSFRRAEYDPWGRLRRVEIDGGAVEYGYDAFGERISKRVLGGEGTSEVPASLVVYPTKTTRDDGVERQSLVRLEERRIALLVDETRVLSLVDDQLGAVRRAVDERGETVLSADPTPFGTLAQGIEDRGAGLASTELVLGFTGQLRDPDTGLVHMGAREYVPSLASFSTPDPYLLAEPNLCVRSLLECHAYGYVAHDPVNFVDETGLSARPSRPGVMGGAPASALRAARSDTNNQTQRAQHRTQPAEHGTPPTQTYYHYTNERGLTGILESQRLFASTEGPRGRHGSGQYFTDIAPHRIVGRYQRNIPEQYRRAHFAYGRMALSQLARRLFGPNRRDMTTRVSYFIEVNADGLNVRQVGDNIFLRRSNEALDLNNRIVSFGQTYPTRRYEQDRTPPTDL